MDNTIFTSLTVINGINVLRGAALDSGTPYFISWLFFNKSLAILVGVIHWISYFQPSLYFKSWSLVLIFPAMFGLYKLFLRNNQRVFILLGMIIILALPGGYFYPQRIQGFLLLGWAFWGIIIFYGIYKFFKK